MIVECTNYRFRINQHITSACQISVHFSIYVTVCAVSMLPFKRTGTNRNMREPVRWVGMMRCDAVNHGICYRFRS